MDNNLNKKDLFFFIRRPRFAVVISIFIVVVGLIALSGLKLEKYPNITPPQIVVSASYPGASADVIESSVASVLENQINGVENMIYMSSTSSDEQYQLSVYFKVGSDRDINLVNVQNRIQQVQPKLPEDVKRLGVTAKQQSAGAGVCIINLSSKNKNDDQLYLTNYASIFIKDEMKRIPGVGDIQVIGASDYSMRIWLNTRQMANLNVGISEVKNAITYQNTQVSAGFLGQQPGDEKPLLQMTLRTKGRLLEPSEFENIIIKTNQDGSNIKLKDFARVELGAQSYTSNGKVDGQPAALIQVIQIPGANVIDIVNAVEKKVQELNPTLPEGMNLSILYDDSLFIRESMKEVMKTIFEATLIVVLVIFFFLGDARSTIIPLAAIPVSLLGVFIFLPGFDMSINLLTLFAMVLAVATVVDDAIVVVENVQRHISEGKTPIQATQLTIEEVGGALIAMALVLMAVFVPISFIPGLSGIMYKQFAVCIAVSIAISALCALTLSPALCAYILKKDEHKIKNETEVHTLTEKFGNLMNKAFKIFNEKFSEFTEFYMHMTHKLVYNTTFAKNIYFVLLVLTFAMFKLISTGFIPDEDQAVLFTSINLPAGSSISRTVELADEVNKRVSNIEGVDGTIIFAGAGPSGNSPNSAFGVVRLKDWSEREIGPIKWIIRKFQGKPTNLSQAAIQQRVNRAVAELHEASIYSFGPPAITGMSVYGGFEFQLLSKQSISPQELETKARELMIAANQDPDMQNVMTTYQANMPQYIVNIDANKAQAQNVSLSELYATLSSTLGTYYVNDFNKLGRVFRVQLQAEQEFRRKANDLSGIYVKSNNGQMVPLLAMVDLEQTVGASSITRFNLYKNVQFSGNPSSGRSSGQAMQAMEKVFKNTMSNDFGFEWSGTSAQERESSGNTGVVIAMALLFVYLFLVALYESAMIPVAVMLISPVAVLGALVFQMMMGQTFDLYSQVGMIMLIGLASKQAILIVEFAKAQYDSAQGKITLEEAAMQAARLRFRPVMMTAIAFILGMLPLVFAHGAGAASRKSVGMTVFGGMIAVAFLGTIMVPAFFVIIMQICEKYSKKDKKIENNENNKKDENNEN